MSKVFLDTNILIYSLDNSNLKKRDAARDIIRTGQSSHAFVISTQVIQEYYVTAVKKFGIASIIAKEFIHSFSHFEIVQVSLALIEEAVDCSVIARISFWDALIVVSAEIANCDEIWTEDLNHGQIVRGIRISNPFTSVKH